MSASPVRIGVIGGSAFSFADAVEDVTEHQVGTPYGRPSSAVKIVTVKGREIAILARHGGDHSILPHAINYRANLWALKSAGIEAAVALATVGGIGKDCAPGTIVIPDQILDYTHSREHTFSPLDGKLVHIDFTEPYCAKLRAVFLGCAEELGVDLLASGTYAATQGPRFESAAEIRKYDRDGADIVGMTGMPEASLARELGICYATIALVVNYAAGIGGNRISIDEIKQAHGLGMQNVNRLLVAALARLDDFECRVPPVITP
ncbi:S-methyl-5'-thioinosine phosphorylase [Pseudomonadota bacterium]